MIKMIDLTNAWLIEKCSWEESVGMHHGVGNKGDGPHPTFQFSVLSLEKKKK
jgi:hypothetical protein